MSEHPEQPRPAEDPSTPPVEEDGERRTREERRSLIDLTRAERGEPERRRLPGLERRGGEDEGTGAS